jgi:hypothetical protein
MRTIPLVPLASLDLPTRDRRVAFGSYDNNRSYCLFMLKLKLNLIFFLSGVAALLFEGL